MKRRVDQTVLVSGFVASVSSGTLSKDSVHTGADPPSIDPLGPSVLFLREDVLLVQEEDVPSVHEEDHALVQDMCFPCTSRNMYKKT